MSYSSFRSRTPINRVCCFNVLDRNRTQVMKQEEQVLCEELRVKKAEIMTYHRKCHTCNECGCGIRSYVDWLEIKISSLILGASAYMRDPTHLEGTQEWKHVVHSYRRAIGICEEEHTLYSQGLSIVLVGYRQGDSIAAGYAYVTS